MCKNICKNFCKKICKNFCKRICKHFCKIRCKKIYTKFAPFLHLQILHFGLHLRPREETDRYLHLSYISIRDLFYNACKTPNLINDNATTTCFKPNIFSSFLKCASRAAMPNFKKYWVSQLGMYTTRRLEYSY